MSVCTTKDLTHEQKSVLRCITATEAPSCIIEAVAGCGKTTVLLHYLRHAIDVRDRVLFVAFNTTTAQWARDCVGDNDRVSIQTFHAFAHSMLPHRQLDPNATFRVFCDLTAKESQKRKRSHSGNSDDKLSEKQLWTATRRTIDRMRCSGMPPEMALQQYLPDAQTELETDVLRLAARVLGHIIKDPSHSIELDDTVYLAAIDTSLTLPHYQGIVVDEIQDANGAQLILLHRLLKQSGPSCRFLAVGDPKQSIYSFRYAQDAIKGLRRQLHSLQRPVTSLSLSICFRCPQSVIALARSIQPSIQTTAQASKGTVTIRSNVTLSSLLVVLQRRAVATRRPILCIQRFNKPILRLLWAIYQRSEAMTSIHWLSPSILSDLREHLTAMLGLDRGEDGDIADLLRTGLVDDATLRSRWKRYKDTRSAHVWDMNPVVRLAIEQSLCAEWYLFLFDHISAALPSSLTEQTIVLSTIHCTKGLTFPGVVAIVDYNNFGNGGSEGPEESHLLYVALTRTTDGLLFIFTEDPYQAVSPYFQVDDIVQTDGYSHTRDPS